MDSSLLTIGSGATFDISGNPGFSAVNRLAGSGEVQLGGNGLAILAAAGTFAGTIKGSGGLEIVSGTQTLTGQSTYSNATQIDAGATLALAGTGSIANSAFVSFAPLGPGSATFDVSQTTAGASVRALFDSAGVGVVRLGSNTLSISSGSSFNGVIADGGLGGGTGGGLSIEGGASQSLGGINTYTGGTNIEGSLALTGSGSIAASSGVGLLGGTASLDISGLAGGTTIQDLSGVVGSTVQLGANRLTVGAANSTLFAGTITDGGAGGAVTKTGTGTLTLTGANSYTGGTTVSGGILQIGDGGTSGSIAGDVLNDATLAFNRSDTVTFDGTISGSGALDKLGTGTLILTADNTYTGLTTIAAGTLQLGNGGTSGAIVGDVLNNGVLAFNRSDNVVYGGNIDGSGAIAYMGPGTVTLTGTISNTGGTVLAGGIVQAGSDSALGAAGATLTFAGGTLEATASFTIGRPLSLVTGGGTIDTAGNSLTVAGNIIGAGGLTKAGTGTLILTGANNYTGGTTVSGGILQGTTSSLRGNILNNAAVVFDQTMDGDYAGVMSGSGSLAKSGTGSVVLTVTQAYTGGTVVNGGFLELAFGASLASGGALTVNGGTFDLNSNNQTVGALSGTGGTIELDSGTLTTNSTANTVFAGSIGGAGGLVKQGSGLLTLSGANTYSGGTTVNAGTLQLDVGGSLLSGGALTVNGGTFDLNGQNQTVGALSGTGGTIELDSGTLTTNSTADTVFAGSIGGAGGLVKQGSGTQTLSGSSLYFGPTVVNAGTLRAGATGAFAIGSAFTVASGASLALDGFDQTIGSLAGAGTVSLGSATLTAGGDSTSTLFSGDITGSGGLTKVGAGTLTLAGATTYTGATTISSGALALSGGGSIANSSGITLADAGAILDISLSSANQTIGDLSGVAGSVVALGTVSLTVGTATSTGFAGVITGNGGGLVKQGGGTLTLSGINSYTGGTTINGGIVAVSSDAGLGGAGGGLTFGGGALATTTSFTTGRAVTLNAAGGTFETATDTTLTLAGIVSGAGGLAKIGAGALVLEGANTYGGGTTVNGGFLELAFGASLASGGALTINGGTFDLNSNSQTVGALSGTGGAIELDSGTLTTSSAVSTTFAGAISGNGNVVKQGTGTLTLSGGNSYTGTTTISAGTLALSGFGDISSSSVVTANGTLDISGSDGFAGISTLAGSGLVELGSNGLVIFAGSSGFSGVIQGSGGLEIVGGTQTLLGINTYTNATQIDRGATLALSGSGSIASSAFVAFGPFGPGVATFDVSQTAGTSVAGLFDPSGTGRVTLGSNTLTITNGSFFNGVIQGAGGLRIDGSANQELGGVNTYTGATTIEAGGLLVLSGSGSIAASSGAELTGANATLDISASDAGQTIRGLSGEAGSLVVLGTNSLTVGASSSTSFAGGIEGSGGLVKQGGGTLTLSGINSYTGGTTINGGIVAVSSDAGLGGAGGGLTFGGGALATTTSFTTGRAVTLNAAGGTFQTATGTILTAIGVVSGEGGLTKAGAGTLILTGANTYTGGTVVSGGILRGTTASLQGNIANNASVIFEQGTTGSYGGVMSGIGLLTKSGTGTVILTANNTYSGGTTISGGILQLGNGGTTGWIEGDVINNGVLAFNRQGSVTFAGDISGAGGVLMMGPGTVTLTGDNSFTGGFIIGGGVVRAGSDGELGAGSGRLTLMGGTLEAAASFDSSRPVTLGAGGGIVDTAGNTVTLSGLVDGIGGLTKTGAGTLTLAGTSSYTGGTTVTSGILAGTTSSLQGNIVNNANVVFDQTATGTYAGAMSGTGALTKSGTGTVILTGANSYTGGTVVSAGILQGNIANNAAVIFDQLQNGTYAGNMTGTGTLAKAGAGTLILTGINAVGGGTTVNAGLLVVNGSLSGGVTVGPGAMLGGSGQLFGTFTANGAGLMPGNSIGTLTVNGSFTQNGGIYQVEVNPAGQSDLIAVTGAPGTATIGGGATVQVLAEAGTYQPSTTYTILSATGGVSGAYAGVTSNFAFLTPTLSYGANDVFLTLVQSANAFASGAQTPNQYAVGTALDIASPAATGDFATVLNAMTGLNTQQGAAALNAISGQPYTGFGTANVAAGLLFMNTVGQQMAGARGGSATTRVALAEACAVACDEGGEPARWGAWMSGLGGLGNIGGNSNAGTFTYSLGGTAFGIDYRLDPKLVVGAAAGYTSGRQWVSGFQGNSSADNYSAALYASFASGGFYADGLAGYAYSDNQLQRVLQIPGLAQRIASGRTGANQFLGQVETGYRIGVFAPAALSPFARLQTVAVSQNGFTESGANSLNLGVAQQNTTSVRTVLGGDLAANLPIGSERLLGVALRLGWAHEYAQTARPMTASFAGAPTVPFTVYGAQPLRDAAVIGLGLNTKVAEQTSIYARYDGEINGRDDAHAFSAGFRMTW